MKKGFNSIMFRYIFIAFIMLSAIYGCSSTKHTEVVVGALKEETIQAINNDRWIFVVNQIIPQTGRSRTATSRYDVRSSKDTIKVQLPYFGRAYSGAAVMDNNSPLDFTSTDFGRTKNEGSNGNGM